VPAASAAAAETSQVSIDITPQLLPCSAGKGPISVSVRWQAPTNVQIWVRSSNAEKLWVTAGGVGERQSGNWVVPGTQFLLKDGGTDKTMAQVTAGAAGGCATNG
jgi:hypothetical protein